MSKDLAGSALAQVSELNPTFSSIMNPEGYLFLGRTESLFGVEHPFQLVHFFKTCA